jgi:radical SAM protein with 4Fe4S-binding SPASM domain
MSFVPHTMSLDVVSQARTQLLYNAEEVTFFGWGEPFLHPRVKGILDICTEYGHDNGLVTYFSTNGLTLLSMIDILKQYQVNYVTISVDGADAEVYNSIRRGSDFDVVCGNIRALRSAIGGDRLHSVPYMRLSFVVMRQNVHQLVRMVDLADALDLPEVRVCFLTVFHQRLLKESLFDTYYMDKYFTIAAQAQKRAKELGVRLRLPVFEENAEAPHRRCMFPFTTMFIAANGDMRPCQSTSQVLGHISDDLQADWNLPEYQKIRGTVNSDDISGMPHQCQDCYQTNVANFHQKHAHIQCSIPKTPYGRKTHEPGDISNRRVDERSGVALAV